MNEMYNLLKQLLLTNEIIRLEFRVLEKKFELTKFEIESLKKER